VQAALSDARQTEMGLPPVARPGMIIASNLGFPRLGSSSRNLVSDHRVYRRHPDVTAAVFPCDHFVLEEAAFNVEVLIAFSGKEASDP